MADKSVFFNRNLSWIDFNERVLEEGLRPGLPPLERLRFLSIVSSNFDEFFMVRVAATKRALNDPLWKDPAGYSPAEELQKTAEKVRSILARQYRCLGEEVLPALAKAGLSLVRPCQAAPEQQRYLESVFLQEIFPVLTPLRLEEEGGLPSIGSQKHYAAFLLEDGEEKKDFISIVPVPASCRRVLHLPESQAWALAEDLITHWGGRLFEGYSVRETMVFKIARDADFSVEDRQDEEFIEAMEEALVDRDYSKPVRMVCSSGSAALREALARRLGLGPEDVYVVDPSLLLDSALIRSFFRERAFHSLRAPVRKNYPHPGFPKEATVWERLAAGDVLLHLPYYSFEPVLRFFQEAAVDPAVIAIKTTLYRTGGDSSVIKALERAARNGKQVTVMMEVKARFDEGRNISWANRLERAGVIVVYGLSGLKVHAKATLVIRRETGGLKRYVHLSTGNYNELTARAYSDLSFFTSRDEMAYDAGLFFNMITGYSQIEHTGRLVIAPLNLKTRLVTLIEREATRAAEGYPAAITAKMNALADTDIIEALYRASSAGVKINLNVRGICMLKPGLPGLSENIRVISIIDYYLEHARVFYFYNGGADEVYLSSADWMVRNMERRVEVMFPILQEEVKEELIEILDAYFKDNTQASQLHGDGRWERLTPAPGEAPFRAQEHFYRQARERSGKPWAPRQGFIVRRSPNTPAPRK